MSYFDFYPFGTKSLVVKFDCDTCGLPVESEEILVPSPDYTAERASDSQVEEEGIAFCDHCEKEFQISIYVTYAGGMGEVHELADGHDVQVEEQSEPEEDEWYWDVASTEQYEIFKKHMRSVNNLLDIKINEETSFSLLVMLYAHIVAATEQFLSSVFIREVTTSDELTRKLIETDPEFGGRKFSLKEIYQQNEKLKSTVAIYLKELIFHDLKKIKPMYQKVLGFDFDDISWLFCAVLKRHDCVHRAGYTKDGEQISLTGTEVRELIVKCNQLAKEIDLHVIN